jgi:hypothetical protein
MINLVFILLSVVPVVATDTSIVESIAIDQEKSVNCPADNGDGYAYGALELNWKCNIPPAFSKVVNLTINTTIIEGTPHWIFLATGTQEKKALLNFIESANVSQKQKDYWTQFLRNIWQDHPIVFDNSTGSPMLIPGKSLDDYSMTPVENATFQEIETYISEQMGQSAIIQTISKSDITVQWAEPLHSSFTSIACEKEATPEDLTRIASIGSVIPDTWYNYPGGIAVQSINHGYVPDVLLGNGLLYAPDNCGNYALQARTAFQSHNYQEAFTNLGYANHFMGDVGQPYHTPPKEIIGLAFISDPMYVIKPAVFGGVIINYKALHDAFEIFASKYWDTPLPNNEGSFSNTAHQVPDYYFISNPTVSARQHGSDSATMVYPLIYEGIWHFILEGDLNFATNPAIIARTKERTYHTEEYTRGLVRYVTGGQYPMLTISATAGPGGSISPSGDVSVRYGEDQSFTITPSTGYVIDKIIVDNNPVSENPYSFSSITTDHTISGTFRENLPSTVSLVQAGTPFNSLKYPQNWPQSDPMTFQCDWDGNGRVYISGDHSALTGVWADDGFTITIQPSGETFDAVPHYSCAHYILDLTSGMRPGVNSLTLTVKNWQGLSMSYGSKNGVDIDQTPYIIQVNSPTVAATGDTTSIEGLPSFIEPKDNGFVINDTFIDT